MRLESSNKVFKRLEDNMNSFIVVFENMQEGQKINLVYDPQSHGWFEKWTVSKCNNKFVCEHEDFDNRSKRISFKKLKEMLKNYWDLDGRHDDVLCEIEDFTSEEEHVENLMSTFSFETDDEEKIQQILNSMSIEQIQSIQTDTEDLSKLVKKTLLEKIYL